ncbi:MAG: hypothetical protein OXG84_03785 [Chloroflexi bacterium]|nr:hypothetical protein [Chloroflexota bacterium]
MSDKVEFIWYENPTRPKPDNGKSGDGKQQHSNSKQQAPAKEPAQKAPVKLAKD